MQNEELRKGKGFINICAATPRPLEFLGVMGVNAVQFFIEQRSQ